MDTDIQNYPGSRWWKFDFHSHTPASSDYDRAEIDSLQPDEWLLAHMRAGVDCVVVADHNCSDWLEKLQDALRELDAVADKPEDYRALTIFPGAEITTSDNIHILALFCPKTVKTDIDGLLRGKLSFSNPGKPNAELMFSASASSVIDAIHEKGGVAIAAHVDCKNGLLFGEADQNGSYRPALSARTLDDVLLKVDALEVKTVNSPAYSHFSSRIEHLALVAGTDFPHNTANAGKRFTWVKMSAPEFEGLKLALLDPESAVRRDDQGAALPQPMPRQWIRSVSLKCLHLRRENVGPLTLRFNPAYNAIIGGRGSGKSTVLEGARLALGRDNELRKLGAESEILKTFENFTQEYSRRDKPGMMLPNSEIRLEIIKGDDGHFEMLQYIWSRQPGNGAALRVSRWDQDCWHETGLNAEQARAAFPVKIFSQKQVLALANTPQALLEYIDDSVREQKIGWQQEFDNRKAALLESRRKVRALITELAKKPALELEYKEADRKARVFANSNFGPLLKAFQRATQQQRAMDDFQRLLAQDVAELRGAANRVVSMPETELTDFDPQTPAENGAVKAALVLREQLSRYYEAVTNNISQMEQTLVSAAAALAESDWQKETGISFDNYRHEMERLQAEGIQSAQEAANAVATVERLGKQLQRLEQFATQLEAAEQLVETEASNLQICREKLTGIRQDFIRQLFECDDMLKVDLRSMADARGAAEALRNILRLPESAQFADVWNEEEGQNPAGFLWDATDPVLPTSVGERLHTMRLDLESGSKQVLRTTLHGKLLNRLKEIPPETFDDLAVWFPEDEVQLEYRPADGASYKSIQQASAGQKTAAMLSFLLAHGEEPLLLDQPEDDLDNALVSRLVVAQLRKNKARRQLIIVTHNANIVVNGDAELVMTMDFAGGQINLASAGGLQERDVRKDICRVMEGGEEAFRQRYKRILKDLEARP